MTEKDKETAAPLRLDNVSLRCLVASNLAAGIINTNKATSAHEAVEIYYQVLELLRAKKVYPPANA